MKKLYVLALVTLTQMLCVLSSNKLPFMIGFISKCESDSKPNSQLAMGKLMSSKLKLFTKTFLRGIFKYKEFDVCQSEEILTRHLTDILLDTAWVNQNTIVQSVIAFIPDRMLKTLVSILSITKIKIWPLNTPKDLEWFDLHSNFYPVFDILPENIINRLVTEFKWNNIAIVEILKNNNTSALPKDIQRKIPDTCIGYNVMTMKEMFQNKIRQKIFDNLKFQENISVVIVLGSLAARFLSFAEEYGLLNKYWVLFARFENTHKKIRSNFISITNTRLQHVKENHEIKYSDDTVCSPAYIMSQVKPQYCNKTNLNVPEDSVYKEYHFKYVHQFLFTRLKKIRKNLGGKDHKTIFFRYHAKTSKKFDNTYALVRNVKQLAGFPKSSKCVENKTVMDFCRNTSIREVHSSDYSRRYYHACDKCKAGLVLDQFDSSCHPCPGRTVPNSNQTECYDPVKKPAVFTTCYVLTAIGLMVTLFTLVIYVVHKKTPVVKSSNFELSIVQLISCILIYVAFLSLLDREPSQLLCTVRPAVMSTLLVSIVAIVVCKAEKILIIFFTKTRLSKKDIKDIFIRQLVIFGFLLTINSILIPASITLPAKVEWIKFHEINGDQFYTLCCSSDNQLYIQLIYAVVILLLSIAQGYRGRKLPTNYNEGNSIIVGASSAACAFAFCIWAILNNNKHVHRVISIIWSTLVISLIFLVLALYGPKIYIILFQSRKNTKTYHLNMMLVDAKKTTEKNLRKRRGSHVKLIDIRRKSQDSVHQLRRHTVDAI